MYSEHYWIFRRMHSRHFFFFFRNYRTAELIFSKRFRIQDLPLFCGYRNDGDGYEVARRPTCDFTTRGGDDYGDNSYDIQDVVDGVTNYCASIVTPTIAQIVIKVYEA